MNQPVNQVYGAQTAARALRVLAAVVRSDEPLTLAQVSRMTGFNRGATYRLLQALADQSFVVRDATTRRYVIGSGLIALSAVVMSRQSIRVVARPVMARIADLTSETVTFHIAHFKQRVCIEVIESTLPIRRVVPIGTPFPLFAGPSGKTIMAFLPDEEVVELLDAASDEGNDVDLISHQLDVVRASGYLACIGDFVPGVGSISVPVFNSSGIAGALTVSGPADRFTLEAIEAVAPDVVNECSMLSMALGHIREAGQ